MADTPRKPLIWLKGEIKTPPFSREGRIEAGFLLGQLQEGVTLAMPHSRPMPDIGAGCHELRVRDAAHNWRIVYRVDEDAILILDVFAKTTGKTPGEVIAVCKQRLARYDRAVQEARIAETRRPRLKRKDGR